MLTQAASTANQVPQAAGDGKNATNLTGQKHDAVKTPTAKGEPAYTKKVEDTKNKLKEMTK